MKILVINTGSSSIKYQLFDMAEGTVMAAGLLERIGDAGSRLKHDNRPGDTARAATRVEQRPVADHQAGMALIVSTLTGPQGVIRDPSEIDGVGHRVVHGGESFQRPALIDTAVLESIRTHAALAPLHNPANLAGIEVARSLFPDVPQVAVFDTAFHQTMPPRAFHYALPQALYREHHVRRYGFHGTSHAYVSQAAAHLLGRPMETLNLITLHLGNGASATAVERGRSVDTSMGLTPLEGLIMGTRCGDIDPAVHAFLADQCSLSIHDIDNLLNKRSGLKGLCGSSDMRDIERRSDAGDELARLAIDMYVYRIRKYIGAYFAVLGTVDALVFTAGVGENSATIRERVCDGLHGLGMVLDTEKNRSPGKDVRAIQAPDSRSAILVVPTDEERAIAEQTRDVIRAGC